MHFFTKCLLISQWFLGSSSSIWPPYKDPAKDSDERVMDLLSRMPIREKMAQLMQGDVADFVDFQKGEINMTAMKDHMFYHSGMLRASHPQITQELSYEAARVVQDWIMNDTSLSLPAIVQAEGLHGLAVPDATVFNSPIGFGSSWNRKLVKAMAGVIGQEARALGIHQLFSPSADLAREPRHGRVEESISEDPYLAGEMVVSYIEGLKSKKVAATVKHLGGFGNSEQGLDLGPVHGGERALRTTWLPPFKKAIDAGAFTVMSAFNSYDGIPSVMNKHLLTRILRNEWGFDYWTTSDYGGTDRLCTSFNLCASDPIDAQAVTLKVLTAGGDTEGGGTFIPKLVEDGRLSITAVDQAVGRVLKAKFEMGLFEDPNPSVSPDEREQLIHTDQAIALAKQLDRESIILLENHGILPLDKGSNIAVIGPLAHGSMNYGGYTGYHDENQGITPLDGIRAVVSPNTRVSYAKGCDKWSMDKSGFPKAIAAAKRSDVAIVVVGTWASDPRSSKEDTNATTGEGIDSKDLKLVGVQSDLIKAVTATGVPTVVILSSGKPVAEPWISNSTAGLLQQFYPSEQGGAALADVLFGDYNPSGRLPISFPKDVGQLPVCYDYLKSGRDVINSGYVKDNDEIVFGHQYVIGDPYPWYEFGFGRSYSTFSHAQLEVNQVRAKSTDSMTFSVEVSNTSPIDGTEVIQLYITDVITSVEVPARQLKGFDKRLIGAGESVIFRMTIDVKDLGLWNQDMEYVVEPGEFRACVGQSSLKMTSCTSFYVDH